MKALSVKQPWAMAICTGLKDVENRTWKLAEAPGRILIHASSSKVPGNWEDYPDDTISSIKNARLMGQIPEYKEMPTGAIIGYVEVYDFVQNSESMWAAPGQTHWLLRDAWLFDEPITGIKGAQGRLFEVDIDENNLPSAHKWNLLFPGRDGHKVILPASDAVMAQLEVDEKEVLFDLATEIFATFFDMESGNLYDIQEIEFVGRDKTIRREVEDIETAPYLGPDEKPIEVIGFEGQGVYWSYIAIILK